MERIESRLAELKREYEAGEQQLLELRQRQQAVNETLLRIMGAIQVLQELQDEPAAPATINQENGQGTPAETPAVLRVP